MPSDIRMEVYKRIVLAKMLYKAGEAACARRNDEMAFTKGILLLHDAAEAALGAAADYLHAKLTGNIYLLQYYDLIKKADPKDRQVTYRPQMRILNTLRNNAKHEGILPNPKSNAHFPATVYALIEDICQTYLRLDFSSVSLKSLIRDKKVLAYIEKAEKEIENKKVDKALISLAYAMYHVRESSTISSLFSRTGQERTLQFPEPYNIEYKTELIQYGIDPYLYYRFKNLTPTIVMHKDTGKLSYWWDRDYGHPKNWTIRNASFCLDFCINTVLKFQREEDEGYTLIHYMTVYEDIIESASEKAIFWNYSSSPRSAPFPQRSLPRRPVLILKKGQSIIGWVTDYKDHLDEWYVISKDIPSRGKGYNGCGYVSKGDIKVTRRERQI